MLHCSGSSITIGLCGWLGHECIATRAHYPGVNLNCTNEDKEHVRRNQDHIDFMNSLSQDEFYAPINGTFSWPLVLFGNWNMFQSPDSIASTLSFEPKSKETSQMRPDEILSHPISESEASSVTNTVQQSPLHFNDIRKFRI